MPGRDSCKQLLQALVRHHAGADNAGMRSSRTRLAILLAAAALGGCAVVPAHDYDATPAVTVYAAPPPPLVEYRGLPPAFGYVWLDGYWDWGRGRYDWVPGRWVSPPPGRFWVPRVWRRDGERWHSHGGHWESHRPPQRLAPQPVWPRSEFHSQPFPRSAAPLHRHDPRTERPPEPHHQASRDRPPPQAQPAVPAPTNFVRRARQQPMPPVEAQQQAHPQPAPRAEAAPRRPEDGRRPNRQRLEDREPGERRPPQP